MTNFNTNTNEIFISADGKEIPVRALLKAVENRNEIYGNTLGKGLSKEDLKDLRQQVMIKVWQARSRYDSRRSCLNTWVSRISENCEKDAFKSIMRYNRTIQPCIFLDEDGEESTCHTYDTYCSEDYAADSRIESRESTKRIEDAIAILPWSYQEVIRYRMDGLKPREIAKELGCTPNVVYTRLHRGINRLARNLGNGFLADYHVVA